MGWGISRETKDNRENKNKGTWANWNRWHSFACMRAKSLQLRPTLATPWSAPCQAPLSMGFPRQGYWSGLPRPSPGDLPDPGIGPTSPALAGGFFTTRITSETHLTALGNMKTPLNSWWINIKSCTAALLTSFFYPIYLMWLSTEN